MWLRDHKKPVTMFTYLLSLQIICKDIVIIMSMIKTDKNL